MPISRIESPKVYGGALAPKGGRVPVPHGPGLGIEPDLCAIQDYLRT